MRRNLYCVPSPFPWSRAARPSLGRRIVTSFVRPARFVLGFALFLALSGRGLGIQVSAPTWHYNNARNGVNSSEKLLTPANVNYNQFGLLASVPLDGMVSGQALYMAALTIQGSVRNVVFVATLHDTVYAFDVDDLSAGPLWQTSLLPPGGTPSNPASKGCANGTGWTEVGIVSTPAINPDTKTMYVVAEVYQNSEYAHYLNALDITTGDELPGWPVKISASYTLDGFTYVFNDIYHINRPAVLVGNGHVYLAFGGIGCDVQPDSEGRSDEGWLMSYNETTGVQEGAFETEPGHYWAAIWLQGAGLSMDSDGYIYGDTGEGPFTPGTNFGTSVLKWRQDGAQLVLADWFTPYDYYFLIHNDLDLNNAPLILPDQPGSFPHEMIVIGKTGTVYLLDRDNLGQFCFTCTDTDSQIVQELYETVKYIPGTPVYWNGRVYFNGHNSVQAFTLSDGKLLTPPAAVPVQGGGHPIITSNGTTNGVLWVIGTIIGGPPDYNTQGVLHAVDAATVTEVYTSKQAPDGRDSLPNVSHFANQIEANGKVFIGAQNSLLVYGLFPALNATKGANGEATVGTSIPLTIHASNPYTGSALAGVSVTFSDGAKGGSFSENPVATNAQGNALTTYTVPTKPLTADLTATSAGFATAFFTETALLGPAAELVRQSGNGQTTTPATTFPNPITAKAVDKYLNEIPGVVVSFSDNGAGGKFSAAQVTTNAKGQAAVSYTPSTKSEVLSITATASGLPAVSFGEFVSPDPASTIQVVSGNGQSAQPSTKLAKGLTVKVTDQYGNAIPNISVSFSDGGAGGTFSPASPRTIDNGNATTGYVTSAVAGTVTITASVTGVSSAATFTVTVQ